MLACGALVVAIGACACGSSKGSSATQRSSSHPSAPGTALTTAALGPDGDADNDKPGTHNDPDEDEVLKFGKAASAADRHTLAALATRYYALAAASDVATACSLLDSATIESVIQEHWEKNGPPSLKGDTCPQIASKLFAERHSELMRQVTSLKVTEVRVKGGRGFVRLRFATLPERLVSIHREHRAWKISVLLEDKGV